MTIGTRRTLQYALSVLLAVVFLFLAFRGVEFGAVYDAALHADYWWVLLMFVVLMISHVVRAWRWRYLLQPIKPGIGLRNLFSGVMIGYMVNNVLPRVGELARPYALGKLESISKTAAFGTIVVERLIDTASFLLLIALMPLLYNGPLRESFPWIEQAGRIITVVTVALVVFLIVLMVRRDWTDRLLAVISRLLSPRWGIKLRDRAHSFLDGLLFVKHPAILAVIVAQSVVIWGLYVVMVYCAFFGFGIEHQVGFSGAVVVLALQSIGVAVPTPGSTGSYHAFTSQALIRLFGIAPAVAVSYATVTHAVSFVGYTIIGLYFFLKDNIRMAEVVNKPQEHVS
jgi:glycosyltransferase 2 family protein